MAAQDDSARHPLAARESGHSEFRFDSPHTLYRIVPCLADRRPFTRSVQLVASSNNSSYDVITSYVSKCTNEQQSCKMKMLLLPSGVSAFRDELSQSDMMRLGHHCSSSRCKTRACLRPLDLNYYMVCNVPHCLASAAYSDHVVFVSAYETVSKSY